MDDPNQVGFPSPLLWGVHGESGVEVVPAPTSVFNTDSAPSQVPGLYSNSDPKTITNCLY